MKYLLKLFKKTPGFTLVELLIVIAILGVLSTVLITAINPLEQLARARDTGRKSDLKQIRNALEAYKTINGTYPVMAMWAYSNSSNWIPALVTSGDLKKVPVDPISSGCGAGYPWNNGYSCWWYAYWSNGTYYELIAHLESAGDPDRCAVKQWTFFAAGGSWCGSYSGQVYAPPYNQ